MYAEEFDQLDHIVFRLYFRISMDKKYSKLENTAGNV